ncbi:MAG: lipocalin [delta proteobacterium MLS_D]|nr:MAG: lipocalin [delta proteobacterium MLS_D]
MRKFTLLFVLVLAGCVGIPEGITPVENFQLERYLGTWYEIARLDHSFERGMTSVTADYSLRADGSIRVINRGYAAEEKRWKEIEGTAKMVDHPDLGFLKVSFFGPFYGSYVIVELDRSEYSYALVCGPNRSYLWILARAPRLPNDITRHLVETAKNLGFQTGKLIYVRHDEKPP